ncbi:MAG: hypothetical protein KKA84_01310 [Bacteroidetes bacterium]|nr:hypothetical protein [Bacteroidota bacterium]
MNQEPRAIFKYPVATTLLTIVLLYTVFTELMLTGFYPLPKPSVLYTSFCDVYNNYPLKEGFLDTFLLTTVALTFVYLFYKIFGLWLSYIYIHLPAIKHLSNFYKYIPIVFFAGLFIILFDYNYYGEFLFLVMFLIVQLGGVLIKSIENMQQGYFEAYKSLNMDQNLFVKKVLWKGSLVEIKKSLPKVYHKLILVAIGYEYLGLSVGMGKIIKLLIDLQDYYGLFSVMIVMGIYMFVIDRLLDFYSYRTRFWEL